MKPAVFLDRDGTINVEKNYLYRIEDFEYAEGALAALERMEEAGYLLIIISNQSGIARGYYSEEDYRKLNEWMLSDLGQKGIHVAGSYHCPHHPEGVVAKYRVTCNCRKPGTELFWRAIREHDVDVGKSYAIGDKMRDLAICGESDAQGILIEGSDSPPYSAGDKYRKELWICRNLFEAAQKMIHAKNTR